MQISVIIPMYNESKIIGQTAQTLSDFMQRSFQSYEILFSDDGSTDGCSEIIEQLSLPCIRVLREEVNYGKGHAIRKGMMEAKGDLVFFTDADLAYGVEVIEAFYKQYIKKKESGVCEALLIGSRNLTKTGYGEYTWIRRQMSKCYLGILGLVGGFRLSDSQCGCKAFTNDVAKSIFNRCTVNGFAFDLEAILWAEQLQIPIEEIPVRVLCHGESNVHMLRDSVKMLRDAKAIRKSIKKATKH